MGGRAVGSGEVSPLPLGWRTLVTQPPADLSPLWRSHLEPLAAHAADVLDDIAGTALLHWDVRADNLMVDEQRVVVVDWVRPGSARPGSTTHCSPSTPPWVAEP